jgi:predicted DNA-binding transcriptional regulator AlpA
LRTLKPTKLKPTQTESSVCEALIGAVIQPHSAGIFNIPGHHSNAIKPNISVWDRSGEIPCLIGIDTVCAMLALGKSAVYELVAKGSLMAPMKLTPGRRGASRWLLSDVVDFINDLAVQRAAITPHPAHSSAVVDGGTAK